MQIIYILDIFGTFIFAITGALRGIEKRLDLFGVLVLSFLTAVGGGTIRDILLNRIPFYFQNEFYIIPIIAGILFTLVFKRIGNYKDAIIYLDAVGLGVFSVIGFNKAYDEVNIGFLGSTVCGLITGIGGGIIRESLVREIPLVFRKEVYATASLAGLFLLYFLKRVGLQDEISTWLSILLIFFVRTISYRFNINLPVIRTK
ncbi:MAG: trimeric intracellular cation channel family protein [bacterium]|nr:trimeric intracellular cation channel family protein [bacterium]MDW8087609.1 trimeric intracellular cation channel family protein [Candidatus Calescibacterium sp.]